jgi:anti-anti-sigma factor
LKPPSISRKSRGGLKIESNKNNDRVTLVLTGRLAIGESVSMLRESIRTQLAEGARHLVLDIGGVSHIDSSALGELLSSALAIQNKGGSLQITGVHTRSAQLLETTKLLRAFNASQTQRPRRFLVQMLLIFIAFAVAVLCIYLALR